MTKVNTKKIIENIKKTHSDIANRTIEFYRNKITILYIKEITDRISLSELIIRPIIATAKDKIVNAQIVKNDIIYLDDCKIETEEKEIENYILLGFTVILFSNEANYIVADTKKVEHRVIATPEITYTMRGPRDCFIENMDINISLIRYRLKSKALRISYHEVGQRTQTRVAVVYFDDIANDTIVNEIKSRIDKIDTDGIIESGELQAFLLNNKLNLFPQMGLVERSDMACGALLEGKVIIIVEGSGIALVAPKVLSEFLWSCDDIYDNKYIGIFLRFFRVASLSLSLTISAIYVATVAFHNDLLPSEYVIMLAESRTKVPFSSLIEVLAIEGIVELLREALIRVPSKIGTGVGIVGAIIIGEAAISAGIFSPLLLIVVSISLISSFIPADYSLVNPFRILKFLLIIITGIFGFYGFILGITFILANLVSTNSFGVPYMTPFAPFIKKDAEKSFFYSKSLAKRRPFYLRVKDKFRSNN